ncbi:MAG: ribbon-helix-helix protein, CopG family [Candidatus Rokubacteria bacterium]|nr:ribbon-helix-helix protein, CopG family [Candidatus Rokubacteria bacterium]
MILAREAKRRETSVSEVVRQALSEHLGLTAPALVITLDRRDFGTVRPRHRRALRLLP